MALQEAVDRHGNPAMAVHALRDIVKGEELLLRWLVSLLLVFNLIPHTQLWKGLLD